MNARRTGLAVALGMAICGMAVQLTPIFFRDKKDNMAVWNLGSWVIEKVSENKITFRGHAKQGDVFYARWKSQGLAVKGGAISGSALKVNGAFELSDAKLSGNVVADLTSQDPSGAERVSTLTTALMSFSTNARVVSIPGKVHVEARETKKPSQRPAWTMEVDGSSSSLTLWDPDLKRPFAIRSGTIAGPVRLQLTSARKSNDEEGKLIPVRIAVSASEMTYQDEPRMVTLVGAVTLDGEDDLVGGLMQASKAIIRLDKEFQPTAIELSGDPGKTTARKPGKRS